MKKALFTLTIALLTISAQAQFKIHDSGHISIGSLTHSFGIQVQPSGYASFQTQSNANYSWGTLSKANACMQKHWVIENQYNNSTSCWEKHMFYVYGNGIVHYTSHYCIGNSCLGPNNSKSHISGENALSTILNIDGYYYKEEPMTSPEEIENSEYIDREAVEGMIGDLEKYKVVLSTTQSRSIVVSSNTASPSLSVNSVRRRCFGKRVAGSFQ